MPKFGPVQCSHPHPATTPLTSQQLQFQESNEEKTSLSNKCQASNSNSRRVTEQGKKNNKSADYILSCDYNYKMSWTLIFIGHVCGRPKFGQSNIHICVVIWANRYASITINLIHFTVLLGV
ncbi:hypothetical protein Glove_340g115 [Diversispora epigaea]|uniref:Uncharacterized protein n=1 Tax=Diversispora epigaea TaxID=1348612 RepID=A0A397HM47_9GLOM|nr:hypothetical protein Glove_340g115 [Diversispora epigaea]